MRKVFFSFLILFFSFFFMANLSVVKANGDPLVMLDEFVVYPNSGNEEWIELLNPSQDSALSLSGWRLVVYQGTEPNYTYRYSQDLSGSVPRGGFLTFATDNGARLPDEGACLVLFVSDTQSVYAVKYGNGTCDSGAGEQDATNVSIEQGKSIYYNLDEQTWNSASSPTRGWCNPGSGDCPTISVITTQMSNESVTTNLGDQADFSRISGLYFQKSEAGQNIGKITFLAEMNFTDRDALSWMQSLDSKLDISQGVISLDADLIKNLTNTQASLTMYNITLNNPTIRVYDSNGTEVNSSGVVSSLSYNRESQTMTFTAAHFTSFYAVEVTSSSSSSSSSSTPGPPDCSDEAPDHAPHLFQIDTTKDSATLYFTPVNNAISYYFIAYGFESWDERFGVSFSQGRYDGVLSYTINHLSPNTKYYFKVRGGHGCMPGPWSNVLAAKTEGWFLTTETKNKSVLGEQTENINPADKPEITPTSTSLPTVEKPQEGKQLLPTLTSQSSLPKKSLLQRILDFILRR